MSLIIKGMSLPSECSECLFSCYDISVGAPAQCVILGEHSARYSRLKNCPLSELPTPHGRLVDSNELLDDFMKAYPVGSPDLGCAFEIIENAETFIKAEVSE